MRSKGQPRQHLEPDEDVSHLLLGEAVAQALEAAADCRLPTQLACMTTAISRPATACKVLLQDAVATAGASTRSLVRVQLQKWP